MSHHIVTVCVVCVLCAAHTPCSAHEDSPAIRQTIDNSKNLLGLAKSIKTSPALLRSKDVKNTKDPKTISTESFDGVTHNTKIVANVTNINDGQYAVTKAVLHHKPHRKTSVSVGNKADDSQTKCQDQDQDLDRTSTNGVTNLNRMEILKKLGQTELTDDVYQESIPKSHRTKRNLVNLDEKYFMTKIFEVYGNGTSITIEGFERLLRKLGLLRLLTEMSVTKENDGASQTDKQFDSVKSIQSNGVSDYENGNTGERCLTNKELLSSLSQDLPYSFVTNNGTSLPQWLFERVCPVLVYQLAGESSSERNGCIRVPETYKPRIPDSYVPESVSRNMVQVWVYSTISVLIISLCGLLGVAVIPVMGKAYYHQLLQFLVALAVGTLCGDALIHLLPHAMASEAAHNHHHDYNFEHEEHHSRDYEEEHNINMWKGLVAMIGLVLFFFTEKGLTMAAEWRKLRQRRNKLPSRVRVMRETEGPNSNVVGEKLCKHKYSSYPYCYGEITTDTQDNHHNRQHANHEKPPTIEEEKPLTSNSNSVSKIMPNEGDKRSNEDWRIDESIVNSAKKTSDGADIPLNETESYTVIIREHETKHHGHTHSHGHVHSAPESMSSVAWMVVMGDGLHNFTDGMAIGAAFSANIAGGFSTAIAVFCHELPHEIGDFAVLLKAGMSAKQAVFYNLLSSVLCFFGMVFGVLLGSTPTATSWMFAAAAGMFIYIALVDMIPELTSSHSAERGSHWQCVLQALGLSCGLGIMLIIALYEHDLKTIFSN